MTDSLFADHSDQDPGLPDKNYLEDLVGEGKKFKTHEELARGKAEADAFIERLKREQDQLRQELNTKLSMEEYVDKLRTTQPDRRDPSLNEPKDDQGSDVPALRSEDLDALIEKKVNDRERARIQTQNQEAVRLRLIESFGNDFTLKLKETATALGLTPDDLDAMAKDRPKAFLKLVGAEGPPEGRPSNSLFTPPPSHTSSPRLSGDRTKGYYDAIKTSDAKKYWTPAVQNAMHQDAQRLGEKFFD